MDHEVAADTKRKDRTRASWAAHEWTQRLAGKVQRSWLRAKACRPTVSVEWGEESDIGVQRGEGHRSTKRRCSSCTNTHTHSLSLSLARSPHSLSYFSTSFPPSFPFVVVVVVVVLLLLLLIFLIFLIFLVFFCISSGGVVAEVSHEVGEQKANAYE